MKQRCEFQVNGGWDGFLDVWLEMEEKPMFGSGGDRHSQVVLQNLWVYACIVSKILLQVNKKLETFLV